YCDVSGSVNATLNEAIMIQGCASEKYDYFSFEIDGGPLSEAAASVGMTTDPTYYNIVNNGDQPVNGTVSGCNDFVEIIFKKKGTYELTFSAAKSNNGFSCDGSRWEGSLGKSKTIDVVVE
ncbi:MAG: hypothetical protein RLP15_13400, partial [Cryomorphaceae bacterium]